MDYVRTISLAIFCLTQFSTISDAKRPKFQLQNPGSGPQIMRGFGGFGLDAMCAFCRRTQNYWCILRYCAGGLGGMGGMAGSGWGLNSISTPGGSFGGGTGMIPPLVPSRGWNPTCAMCQTQECRRLWCFGGFRPGGRFGGFGPSTVSGFGGFGPSTVSGYAGFGPSTVSGYAGFGPSTVSGYAGFGPSTVSGYGLDQSGLFAPGYGLGGGMTPGVKYGYGSPGRFGTISRRKGFKRKGSQSYR